MCLEVDHVTQMCTNMAGINSVTSRENDLLVSVLVPDFNLSNVSRVT